MRGLPVFIKGIKSAARGPSPKAFTPFKLTPQGQALLHPTIKKTIKKDSAKHLVQVGGKNQDSVRSELGQTSVTSTTTKLDEILLFRFDYRLNRLVCDSM